MQSFFHLPVDSSTFRLGVADGSRVASSTRRSTTCCSSCYNTQDHGSAVEERGFPMPIIGSVLRSRCWSYYPFLSVRYILPLSDSKSNASFIPIGNITGLRRHRTYHHLEPPNGFQDLLEISRRRRHPVSRLRAWVLSNRDCSTLLCVPRSWRAMQLT